MKNIVVLDTSIGSFNQGDEIINISAKRNWPQLFEDNYVIKIASHQPIYSIIQNLYYGKSIQFLKNADYKFLIGTNALYTNMLRPMPNWNIRPWNTSLLSNVVCVGVGIGENSKKTNCYTRYLYKKVLSKQYIHSTRDQKTCDYLISLGYKAVNTGCPTLWGLTPEHCKMIPVEKTDRVVFTLTSTDKDAINDKLMIDILCNNYKEVYFWAQNIRDLEYLRSIYKGTKVKIVGPNVESYSNLLSSDIDYVGNRLHGGIFALQHCCRTIIISIDYRAREMSKNFSFECIDRTNIKSELQTRILESWETSISGLDFELIEKWKKQFDFNGEIDLQF